MTKSKANLNSIEALSGRDPSKTDLKKRKSKIMKSNDENVNAMTSGISSDIYGAKDLPPTSPKNKRPPTSPSLTHKMASKGH